MKLAWIAAVALVTAAQPARASAAAAPHAAGVHATATRPLLPFLHDDYPKAVALARVRKVPLFIEAWAPW